MMQWDRRLVWANQAIHLIQYGCWAYKESGKNHINWIIIVIFVNCKLKWHLAIGHDSHSSLEFFQSDCSHESLDEPVKIAAAWSSLSIFVNFIIHQFICRCCFSLLSSFLFISINADKIKKVLEQSETELKLCIVMCSVRSLQNAIMCWRCVLGCSSVYSMTKPRNSVPKTMNPSNEYSRIADCEMKRKQFTHVTFWASFEFNKWFETKYNHQNKNTANDKNNNNHAPIYIDAIASRRTPYTHSNTHKSIIFFVNWWSNWICDSV